MDPTNTPDPTSEDEPRASDESPVSSADEVSVHSEASITASETSDVELNEPYALARSREDTTSSQLAHKDNTYQSGDRNQQMNMGIEIDQPAASGHLNPLQILLENRRFSVESGDSTSSGKDLDTTNKGAAPNSTSAHDTDEEPTLELDITDVLVKTEATIKISIEDTPDNSSNQAAVATAAYQTHADTLSPRDKVEPDDKEDETNEIVDAISCDQEMDQTTFMGEPILEADVISFPTRSEDITKPDPVDDDTLQCRDPPYIDSMESNLEVEVSSDVNGAQMNALHVLLTKRDEASHDPPDDSTEHENGGDACYVEPNRQLDIDELMKESEASTDQDQLGIDDLINPGLNEAASSVRQDPPSINTGDVIEPIPYPEQDTSEPIELTVVRQRKQAPRVSSEDISTTLQLDPPESSGDAEVGHDESQHVPLIAGTVTQSTSSSFYPSLRQWYAKSRNVLPSLPPIKNVQSKLPGLQFTCLRSYPPTKLRLVVLVVLFGLMYTLIDPFYFISIHLDDTHLNYQQLSFRLSKAQSRLNKTLADEYGEYSELLFNYHGFMSNSLYRLRRRMMFKILHAGKIREHEHDIPVNFTWVTAGDGAAAGYGNL
jgi:hypothetical protein